MNRDKLGRFASNTKRLIAESWRKAKIVAAIMTIGITAHSYFVWAETPVVVEAVEEKVLIEYLEVEKEKGIPEVMSDIADCESGKRNSSGKGIKGSARQFDNFGFPIENVNKAPGKYFGTIDVGKFGINRSIWGAKAHELGYDIYTLEGNTAMAIWLFENYGTEPWDYTSGSCWQ